MISVHLATDEHQMLVRKMVDFFESQGLTITCASSGYIDCKKLTNYEPDVRALDVANELNYIGEAKVCSDLRSEYTKGQFKEFSNRVMRGGKSRGKDVPFYIMVPERCKSDLCEVLKGLGLFNKGNVHVI